MLITIVRPRAVQLVSVVSFALSACASDPSVDPMMPGPGPGPGPGPSWVNCTGFADAPSPWALPYALRTSRGDYNDLTNSNHNIVDIDGDGQLEFVVIRDEERTGVDPLVGRHHWLVFDREGEGFASTPTEWALPYSLLPEADFDFNRWTSSAHTLFDIDGDGRLEFIVLKDDERLDADPLVGRHHWLVFDNSGSGFSSTPTEWTLPYSLLPAEDVDFTDLTTGGHALADMNGDGRADFVMLTDEERVESLPLVGRRHWLVYANTGGGFATTPSEWSLPYSLLPGESDFSSLATSHHAVLDIDGDGRVEFVMLDEEERGGSDALVGRVHWLVFDNTGSGFNASAQEWALPYTLLPASGADYNDLANSSHALLDIDGDGRPEFVVNDDRERAQDPLVGRAYWLVFDNLGDGFSPEAATWSLPYSLLPSGRDYNDLSNSYHALVDLDGDRRLEFVVLDDRERTERDPLVGTHHWLVFQQNCEG